MSPAALCTCKQHLLTVIHGCMQIAAAYEVLSDDKKKSVYDQVQAGCSLQSNDACACPPLQLPSHPEAACCSLQSVQRQASLHGSACCSMESRGCRRMLEGGLAVPAVRGV